MATCRRGIFKVLIANSLILKENRVANIVKLSNIRLSSSLKSSTVPKLRNSTFLFGICGLGLGAIVGGGYSYYKIHQARAPLLNEEFGSEVAILKELPNIQVSRQVVIPTDNTGLKLKLFQYPTCPFCCKVRAFLDYYGFSYDVIEVDPVLRQQISWSAYKKVPILLAEVNDGYQQLNDSSMIISALTSYLHEKSENLTEIVKCYPNIKYNDDGGSTKSEIMNRYFLMFHENIPEGKNKENIMEERKWRKWADDVLVHVLSPNVYRSWDEAVHSFRWFSEVGEWDRLFPAWERNLMVYGGAFAMWIIGKQLKKRHNLRDDVRQSLYEECTVWVKALHKKGTLFLGGAQPNLADLAVFGVLSSIEGCQAFKDLLHNTKIGPWYNSMKMCVQNHGGSGLTNK